MNNELAEVDEGKETNAVEMKAINVKIRDIGIQCRDKVGGRGGWSTWRSLGGREYLEKLMIMRVD